MNCKLWINKALPLIERSLPPAEEAAYRAHLAGCPACRAEVAQGEGLVKALRALPDPQPPRGAAEFDRAVLTRIRAAGLVRTPAAWAVPARAPVRAPAWEQAANDPARAAAARSIATRSRLAGRPLFAGERPALEPSFLLMAFGITIASMATTVFFGEWMVRTIGTRIVAAVSALGGSGAWLSARVSEAMVAMVAILRILRGVLENVTPWFEAVRELMAARGPELLMAAAAMAFLFGVGVLLLRRNAERDVRRDVRGL
ncbi:MAG TPA: zf-HC2 domain-containing protein [Candidatus Udaeobacter sp.]|nr:zf-HC2 domain-containing protein [Candidatus Udaeobacter sp.]